MANNLFVGKSPIIENDGLVKGEYVSIGGEDFYRIANYDLMKPFFMTLVSSSDHWMFISSTGGLTAGRKNENSSLFPYYTDDKLTDSFESTGSKSIFRVHTNDKMYLWEPFSNRYQGIYKIRRDLYKNVIGNKIIFEETNEDLSIRFKYSWQFSEKFGFVRKSNLINLGIESCRVEILDGFQNILPYGINSSLQNERSNLVNAYKKCELEKSVGLGLFMLSSIIVDKAEPSEALKATTVWSSGLEDEKYLLSSNQINDFRSGRNIEPELNIKAFPGAYLINVNRELEPDATLTWQFVAELSQDHTSVNNLIKGLKSEKAGLLKELEADINNGSENLKKLVAAADGLQLTKDKLICSRHYMNVMFNIMRGGIFDEGYHIDSSDFIRYAQSVNKEVAKKNVQCFEDLPEKISYQNLLEVSNETSDPDLIRISLEYLPLTFSRRHGDPSRPWNKFSIETRKKDGSKNLTYQGNWRDIFQNWEALAISYPDYLNSMISKFVNASTIDGYNPYRITRDGVDWEVIEPDDPWSFIGYWGDHQIVYLLKLLELSYKHKKESLIHLLDKDYFVYANVPYAIKSYEEIVANPKDTIDFDDEKEAIMPGRVSKYGADGKMVFQQDGKLLKASLTEKLLVTLLAKLSNFVPEGGIWLNTQRPEWNDANNALVGNGISMVTLYYIRRYIGFCIELFGNSEQNTFAINSPVSLLLKNIHSCFKDNIHLLSGSINNRDRRKIMDSLGEAGHAYRKVAYEAFNDQSLEEISLEELLEFYNVTIQFLDHTIRANKREDGLYHSYNLLQLKDAEASIEYLYEMLEGQVAVLSAGVLSSKEVLQVLETLKSSKVYRPDQYSYILYPDRELPRFLDKNNIPDSFISSSKLAQKLIRDGNTALLSRDENGNCHFNGSFTNTDSLKAAFEELEKTGYKDLVEKESEDYLKVFEQMFNHRAFTGRSGTFFGYEGLGSIYWHMVSKLQLAVQENLNTAVVEDAEPAIVNGLIDHYYEIRAGVGVNKPPDLYGAFPTDPYSHTPATKGAQQPGMTGQVKEDIISRWAELGLKVEKGSVYFDPYFLSEEEILSEPISFEYYNVDGQKEVLEVKQGELAFTYCQVPVIYSFAEQKEIEIHFNDGSKKTIAGQQLDVDLSNELFARSGGIRLIRVACQI